MARKRTPITQARLKELLHYNPDTGEFTWRVKTNHGVNVGEVAGTVHTKGYRYIGLDGGHYVAHRLAFLYMEGRMPPGQVDHINRVRDDNRWSNLRAASGQENQWNTVAKCNSRLGMKGIYFNERLRKYTADIRVNGRTKHLGCFETVAEAKAARNTAAMLIHGKFFVKT
jgi:hypothetical protein